MKAEYRVVWKREGLRRKTRRFQYTEGRKFRRPSRIPPLVGLLLAALSGALVGFVVRGWGPG